MGDYCWFWLYGVDCWVYVVCVEYFVCGVGIFGGVDGYVVLFF